MPNYSGIERIFSPEVYMVLEARLICSVLSTFSDCDGYGYYRTLLNPATLETALSLPPTIFFKAVGLFIYNPNTISFAKFYWNVRPSVGTTAV